jgi:hypothetical protein
LDSGALGALAAGSSNFYTWNSGFEAKLVLIEIRIEIFIHEFQVVLAQTFFDDFPDYWNVFSVDVSSSFENFL